MGAGSSNEFSTKAKHQACFGLLHISYKYEQEKSRIRVAVGGDRGIVKEE